MEPIGAIAEGEWSSLSGIYTTEEADFMAQLLGNCPIPMNELDGNTSLGNSSAFWGSHESTMNTAGFSYSLDGGNSNSYCFSQGSSGGDSILFPSSSSQESFYLRHLHPILGSNNNDNSSSISLDFCMGDANNTSSFFADQDDDKCLNNQEMISDRNMENLQSGGKQQPELEFPDKNTLQPKRESAEMHAAPEPVAVEDKLNNPSENLKKRSRATDVQKNKRNVKSKKNQKAAGVATSNNEEEKENNNNNNNNAGLNKQQTLSSSCSEDESNSSQDLNGGESSSMSSKGKAALNLNGKTRASRGSATDPQSLYARKRRERINERLRILQNLVPNGTKVDISTMLEEAVQYVKFLQLQIKLLSSDDLWMYAPIAYNGMNIGLDHLKLTSSRLS